MDKTIYEEIEEVLNEGLEYEDEIEIDYTKNEFKRGLDSFQPGQLIMIRLPGLTDDDYEPESTPEASERRRQQVENSPKIPAVIIRKHYTEEAIPIPTYDVGFITRWRSGEMSGINTLSHNAIWRYLASDKDSVEGIPPMWFVDDILKNWNKQFFDPDFDIDNDEIHFTINTDREEVGMRVYLRELASNQEIANQYGIGVSDGTEDKKLVGF